VACRSVVPLSPELTSDARCSFVNDDFFARVADGIEPAADGPRRFDVILVDIDHTPSHHLSGGHADFYGRPGMGRVRAQLQPGGVFGLWSDDDEVVALLDDAFATSAAHVVSFPNLHTGGESACTVYVGTS
jgi:spermidine synthase